MEHSRHGLYSETHRPRPVRHTVVSPLLVRKAQAFRALHLEGTFVMPCAWDAGSARLFDVAGFAAIGTTSGGVNWSNARPDYVYAVDRDTMLNAYGSIVEATTLPVSGDLEDGYGTTPDEVADTIQAAIDQGLVGGSIEDQDRSTDPGLISIEAAVERIMAAREVADIAGIDFTLTARAESYFGGVNDPFGDAVERANQYLDAGANCIFVPGLADLATISRLVAEVDGPVSVGIGSGGAELSVESLADAGVRRISTGGALPRALAAAALAASKEMLGAGTFSFTADAIDETRLNALFG